MAEEWYYTSAGQQAGPVSDAELRQLAAAGRLRSGDLVWREGMPQWTPATSVPGLMPEAPSRRARAEPEEGRRPRYAEPERDDRRDPDRRGRDRDREYDGEEDDEPVERVRRRRKRQGMSSGAKVALGLVIGGGVLLVIIVVIVVVVLVANSTNNVHTFSLRAGETRVFEAQFKAGVRTVITVTSEQNTDVDLFVFGPGNVLVGKDEDIRKDCRVDFVPRVTGTYRLQVVNRLGVAMPNGPNRCTLRWDPP